MKSNQRTFRDSLPGLEFTFLKEKIILSLTPKAWQRIAMLLRYLLRVHLAEAKVWNVSSGNCQANGTNAIILQTMVQKTTHYQQQSKT